MAKVTGALMSLTASGTIAQTLTYAAWKGVNYVRTRVIPANPRSTAQQSTRNVFKFVNDLYKFLPGIAREPWIAAVRSQAMTEANLFASKNVGVLRDETDLAMITLSPGAAGGIPPQSIVLTPGTNQISVAVTGAAGPTGWTLTAAQAVAVKDQDPHDAVQASPVAGEDTTDPYTIVLDGLDTGDLYQVGVWLKWLTATGATAYSTALMDSATPT